MNFLSFPIGAINLFPGANGTLGSQLMTEYNLLSRETVDTDARIEYRIGKSFTHGENDFSISVDAGSPAVLQISTGRALVNGHYFESLQPVTIDLLKANNQLVSQAHNPLLGSLAVGLKAMYATQDTLAGSILVQNEFNMFAGVQVVILPVSEFTLPIDVYQAHQAGTATADLLLGTFKFIDGNIVISSVQQNGDKHRYFDASRIYNIERMLEGSYVKKTGLNPKSIYALSGNGSWCQSEDSMMVWDRAAITTTDKPAESEAQFIRDALGNVHLAIPHKQIHTGMTNAQGKPEYFATKYLKLPGADFSAGIAGVVTPAYTQSIKNISSKIDDFYRFSSGRQRGFISVLEAGVALPPISRHWAVGDYILVRDDQNISEASATQSGCATMYVVCPGRVTAVGHPGAEWQESQMGMRLGLIDLHGDEDGTGAEGTDPRPPKPGTSTEVVTDYIEQAFAISTAGVAGEVGKDYLQVNYHYYPDDNPNNGEVIENYYYVVTSASERQWSAPVVVTGNIPMAQELTLGGFYNVPETFLDGGYVRVDENGHLRLVDYALLRSGTLAYQLGENFEVPTGVMYEEVQAYLDEYVNSRVAFANAAQMKAVEDGKALPNMIEVIIPLHQLTDAEDISTLNIYNIDSRFNTGVTLRFTGTCNSDVVINISDCEKIRIIVEDCNPTINVYRSCMYYDPAIINYILQCNRDLSVFTGMEDIRLWYARFEESDPTLLVDQMTVRELSSAVTPNEIDYWNDETSADGHIRYALESLTFSGNGTIVGAGMYVKYTSTSQADGTLLLSSTFKLPNGIDGLWYPQAALVKPIKITGSFVAAYTINSPAGYRVSHINFTALSQTYNVNDPGNAIQGTVAFLIHSNVVESSNVEGLAVGTNLDCFDTNKYHTFYGRVSL